MLLTSTDTLENKNITHYYGLVTSESLLGVNNYKDLFSGIRDVVTGRTSQYELELQNARNEVFKSLEEKAIKKGANAIIGLKLGYDNLGGTMGNTILITGYGTAVRYEE